MRHFRHTLLAFLTVVPALACGDDSESAESGGSTTAASTSGADASSGASSAASSSSSSDPGTGTEASTTDGPGDSSSSGGAGESGSSSSTGASVDAPTTVAQAVNSFQNAMATMGVAATVDSQGPIEISDEVELPGFAFGTYDVDVSADNLTMTLIADPANLMITMYDDTTFDRYYYAFDQEIVSAELDGSTDPNFAATVELLEPGTTVTTATSFVDGLPTEWTFENGAILVTIGEGTDLNEISANGGSLTVNF